MVASEINERYDFLKILIHRAIVNSVHFVVNECNHLGSTPQEPDFIASLTLNFTPALFKILKAMFPGKKFSVTGVYCHQKPIVNIGQAKDPELGDLLILYTYKDLNGNTRFNSLLLQAKISQLLSTTVSTSDYHQLTLYTDWPKFTYKRAGILNGTQRDILPKTINDGAQYLLIDNDPVYGLSGLEGTFPMGCAIPAKTLNIDNNFADELIDFLKFKSGRTFESRKNINDEWSKMIWEILDITKAKASKRKNAGLNNFPRQNTLLSDGCFFFMSDITSEFEELRLSSDIPNQPIDSNNYFNDENPSLSIILIECNDVNQQ